METVALRLESEARGGGLAREMLAMKLKDIVSTRRVHAVDPRTSIREAARMMAQADVGILPVVSGDEVLGTLTDRDITVRSIAEGRDPGSLLVAEVMSRSVFSCSQEDDLEDAARVMQEKQVRRVLVLDDSGGLLGIVSLGDIATSLAGDGLVRRTLAAICSPGAAEPPPAPTATG